MTGVSMIENVRQDGKVSSMRTTDGRPYGGISFSIKNTKELFYE